MLKINTQKIYKVSIHILISIVVLFIVYVTYYSIFTHDYIDNSNKKYDLNNDGVCIIKNVFNENEIQMLKNKCARGDYKSAKNDLIHNHSLKSVIQKATSDEYKLQDYIWIIQKSSVHTCHRDNNGDFFNEGQKHPSYTMLIYLEDMEKCLGVIPKSHKNASSYNFNLTNQVVNLLCNKGDIIIFNANLIHVGTLNKRNDNIRIQMKITHKDDIETLSYYENFNKVLNQDNVLPKELIRIQRNFSCMFPGLSNITQSENIRTARGSDNGVDIGIFQKMFSYMFYGNSRFYDLPNAF